MKAYVQIKKDKESGEHYFDFEDFKDLFDISKIDTYDMRVKSDGSFSITFYDINGNVIIPKATNET